MEINLSIIENFVFSCQAGKMESFNIPEDYESTILNILDQQMELCTRAKSLYTIRDNESHFLKGIFSWIDNKGANAIGVTERSFKILEDKLLELNLSFDCIPVFKLTGILLNDEIKDGVLLIIPEEATPSLVSSNESGDDWTIINSRIIGRPKITLLIFKGDDPSSWIIGLSFKGLLPFQIPRLKDEVLEVKPLENSFHMTSDIMKLSSTFIKDALPDELADKTEKSGMLERSLNYFKENDTFQEDEYVHTVFDNKAGVGDFRNFRSNLGVGEEALTSFEISREAVQDQSKVFKSILKLDRNFHIYIHGDRRLIERGIDESGRKYYKIFYDKEQ